MWKYWTENYVMSSPAVCDSRVFIGSDDGNVYCLDAADGSLMWKYWTENYVKSSPAVCDSRVFIGSDDGNVYCLGIADNN
jgi:outer membrane protein assembly factor BamB